MWMVGQWVEDGPGSEDFRQAVHIVLCAISGMEALRASMVMKGGMLMALRYGSSRFTKDVDFSTRQALQGFDRKQFATDLSRGLVRANETLGLSYPVCTANVQTTTAGL